MGDGGVGVQWLRLVHSIEISGLPRAQSFQLYR